MPEILKNEIYSSRKSTEFDIIIGRGINKQAEIFDLGLSANLIQKKRAGIITVSNFWERLNTIQYAV